MNFANKISVFRVLSVPFFISTLLYYHPQRPSLRFISLAIFLLAVVSDAIDGYIARVKKQQTRVGSIIDPLADKVLLSSAFLCIYAKRTLLGEIMLPLWVVLLVISRDLLILLGAAIILIFGHRLQIRPSIFGKLTTVFQMSVVVGVLLQYKYSFLLWWVASLFTILSGLSYLKEGLKILFPEDVKVY